MDGWLTYADFTARYPDTALTEAQFPQQAADAALLIHSSTHWRSALPQTGAAQALLAQCQAALVHLAAEADTGWDGMTSVNNHGYTESYAPGADRQRYLHQRQQQIIHRVLGAPATRWMLYQGGVYHPPRGH